MESWCLSEIDNVSSDRAGGLEAKSNNVQVRAPGLCIVASVHMEALLFACKPDEQPLSVSDISIRKERHPIIGHDGVSKDAVIFFQCIDLGSAGKRHSLGDKRGALGSSMRGLACQERHLIRY